VLVLVAVTVFPLVFDTQPRPMAVDVPIQIPDRAKAKPLQVPASAPEVAASAESVEPKEPVPVTVTLPASAAQPAPASPATLVQLTPKEVRVKEDVVPPSKVAPKPVVAPAVAPKDVKHETPPPLKLEPKPEPKAEPKVSADDGRRARNLLNGRDDAKPAAIETGRFIVQAGTYPDAAKAREARLKIERAGLTTYTQVIETKDGDKRIRVRIGPFSTKSEADKAAGRIRDLDLSAAVLSL